MNAIVFCLALAASAAAQPPNVLFIIADDLNTNLGSYGYPTARTPHLDALAKRGVRFAHAYNQFPHCNPSRASLLTGRRPDTTRVYDLKANFREALPNVVTLPQHFRAHGYHTVRIGKIFHQNVPGDIGAAGMDDAISWVETVNPRGRDKTHQPKTLSDAKGGGKHYTFGVMEDPDEAHADHAAASSAVKILERHAQSGAPLFLALGLYRPHVPLYAPRRFFDAHPPARVRLLPEPAVPVTQLPPPVARNGAVPSYQFEATEAQRRELIAAYDATVSFMDEQVGRVLAALDRLDLWRRTIVVFTSDHGYHLGDHGLWGKRSLFEESTRVPLIFAGAGTTGRGVARGIVELVDLYPTLADLAGLPAPAGLEGTSRKPLLERTTRPGGDAAYSQALRGTHMGRSIRTAKFRYTEWDGGRSGVELYDLRRDAREQRNRAEDPAMKRTREELRARLYRVLPAAPVL